MWLLIGLAIITIISLYIVHKTDCKGSIAIIAASIGYLTALIFLIAVIFAIIAHNDLARKCKLTEYEERYKTITQCCKSNPENTATLAQDIAAYNSDVLNGRSQMKSSTFSFFSYDFYNELPLIETD